MHSFKSALFLAIVPNARYKTPSFVFCNAPRLPMNELAHGHVSVFLRNSRTKRQYVEERESLRSSTLLTVRML